jgi:epoxyqueuosine reductase QueG
MNRAFIYDCLCRFVADYQASVSNWTKWRRPLMGTALADDPLFGRLKQAVSPDHALPSDLLPDVQSVIAYFVPFDKSIGRSNVHGRIASEEWARAYIETNKLLDAFAAHMKQQIESLGFSVATIPPTHDFDRRKLISTWSHRHAAWIAGLGTFGLNNMLITESGCCGRIGAFLTGLKLEPDRRSEGESCLYRFNGSCGCCVRQCVGDALFTDGFDRHKCYAVCLENMTKHAGLGKADVCGKCLTGVPCAFADPVKRSSVNP